ncbi:DNA-binding transcriptional MerR regulator [Kribbella amoyensis]|uniref:DNA-binding transcriptional MerR regulator n=1 Tax=Kribbella amoyensis TaxID=996641 RepID=A0A561BS90_9ACTN|nr:MerR family transcriptional regulator [Kribbella amoyensis]TWD81754.1 DNA-binding transcriptional MerR regulator [Kribbella amoyensis]
MTRGTDDLTVGRVAALVGISVRTLHHWDVIGLVVPSERTPAGYRLYAADDVARIHRVLVYKELGLPLAEIARLLDDPAVDPRRHLQRQRSELVGRISRLEDMVAAVDRMLEATTSGLRLTPAEQVEIFGTDWQPEWTADAEERWGDTEAWAQYSARTAALTPADWRVAAATTEELNAALATAKRAGVDPGSTEANALAERHRALYSQYFDCGHARHVCLARRFLEDADFATYYESLEPGLTPWLYDTVAANASLHGVDPATASWD